MSEPGRLFVCSTPIGNLDDVTKRLADTLAKVDVVYAEDTRRVATLLNHLGTRARTRSLFAGNEVARTEELLEDLRSGSVVALVSDAGMPTISDPGAAAVRRARAGGFDVTVVPGPSAVTASLAVSGFPADRFVFEGFLPRKGEARRRRIESIGGEVRTVVLFLTPHRLAGDLEDLLEAVGPDRAISIGRELTKMHEEVWVGKLGEAVEEWSARQVKGELTAVLGPIDDVDAPDFESALNQARDLVASGVTVSEASRVIAIKLGLRRRAIYQALLEDQELS